jgi:hypothetical protein
MSAPSFGQTANTVAGSVANQPSGTVALANKAQNAEATVTITNSAITATSIIIVTPYNQGGDTTANVQFAADVRSVSAGSAVVHYTNLGAGTSAGTWALFYWIIN